MAHAQKTDLAFQRNGRVHLNRRGSQFSRLLAVEECGSAGRTRIDRVPRHSARVVATLSNSLFPLHFPSHASTCAITFRTAPTARIRQKRSYVTLFVLTLQSPGIIRSVKAVTQPSGQDSTTGMGWGLASSKHCSYKLHV